MKRLTGEGAGVQARISVIDGDGTADLESLASWLGDEPGLSGRVRTAARTPRPGEMGALSEALLVAVGSGGAISVLATSLNGWLSRPRAAKIRIRVTGESGVTVELDAENVSGEQAELLIRRALDPAPPPGD
jgi:hypothetical protein